MNPRALSTLLMLISFLLLPPSGIALHLADPSSQAGARFIFMAIHNVAAVIFLVAGAFHVVYNRRPLRAYMAAKTATALALRKELVVSLAVVSILTALSLLHVFTSHF